MKWAFIVALFVVGCGKVPPTQPDSREGYEANPLSADEYIPPVPDKEPFNITLKGLDGPEMASTIGFAYAAARKWEKIIVEGLPDVGEIDDLVIKFVDGGRNGKTIASAYPSLDHLRHGSGLPCYGVITIYDETWEYFRIGDMSDVENSDVTKIIFHEIGHVLGFDAWALFWGDAHSDKIETTNGLRYFTGESAIEAYREALYEQGEKLSYALPNLVIPLEPDSFHWRYPALKWDIMSPYFHRDNRLTKVTLGALQDLGYVVDMSQAKAPHPSRLTKPAIGRPHFYCDGQHIHAVVQP